MSEEIDNVNHPAHYTEGFAPVSIECIDITRHLPFDLGNAFKYVWRAGKKGDRAKAVEDLDKALWYLDDYRASLSPVDQAELKIARAVFLLIGGGSARYCALHYLLTGKFTEAAEQINILKRGFEKLEGAGRQ